LLACVAFSGRAFAQNGLELTQYRDGIQGSPILNAFYVWIEDDTPTVRISDQPGDLESWLSQRDPVEDALQALNKTPDEAHVNALIKAINGQ